jgi:hypothetical protein
MSFDDSLLIIALPKRPPSPAINTNRNLQTNDSSVMQQLLCPGFALEPRQAKRLAISSTENDIRDSFEL